MGWWKFTPSESADISTSIPPNSERLKVFIILSAVQEAPGAIIHPPQPESDLYVTPIEAAGSASSKLPQAEGDSSRPETDPAALWDDFPNGRFGDYKSPAFGAQGPWGGVGISVSLPYDATGKALTLRYAAKRGGRSMGTSNYAGRPDPIIFPPPPLQNLHNTILF